MSTVVEHYYIPRFGSLFIEWEEVWVYANGCTETSLHLTKEANEGLNIGRAKFYLPDLGPWSF